jgi:Xaa-Pro aminopeptidase
MGARRERAAEVCRAAGADLLLAAPPSTVAWLTGHPADLETGPSPFALAPLALLEPGSPPILIVAEDEAEAAADTGCEVAAYPGFGLGPVDPAGRAATVLERLVGRARVATEGGSLPAALAAGLDWLDATRALASARAVKDPDELDRLRAAIRACNAGQAAARAEATPGTTELELWGRVRAAIEGAAGARVPVLADLVSGERTSEVGGPPSERALAEGDLVLCDLVPRVAGYWGDSCSTFCLGEPGEAARRAHRRCRESLARAVELVRAGAVAGEVDAAAREGLDYPHHTGHGIGTAWHEEPRIVPGATTVLEEGMVVALEPGSYADAGVRVEQVVLVTADGCEVLSEHELSL